MLAKPYRLHASIKFPNPSFAQTPFFRILSQSNSLTHNRFGFVVSKKIDKRAVVRNRLKRVLREVASTLLVTGDGKDVLFIVKKSFVTEKTEDMFFQVQEALKKIL